LAQPTKQHCLFILRFFKANVFEKCVTLKIVKDGLKKHCIGYSGPDPLFALKMLALKVTKTTC
jgi:hypothetical protein